jgi:hypothetical protein
MSRFSSILTIAAAALTLAACAQDDGVDGYAWSYQQDEYEGAKLAYGAPSSDDVLLMMTCAPGSGTVLLSALTEKAQNDIVLTSGSGKDRFAGAAMPSELGGALVEAEARAKAPSLDHFAETGDLVMLAGQQKVSLAASGEERAGVKQFFETCQQA